jgi:hypothetical protein
MVIVFTCLERNNKGLIVTVVSHGIDADSWKSVPLPQVSPQELGAVFDETLNEYVLH